MTSVERIRTAAEYYARNGMPIFPVIPGGKSPRIAKANGGNGCKDATTDAAQIKAWWDRWPDCNIGRAMGNGTICIDVDQKPAEGKYGKETLESLEEEFGKLPETQEVLSANGGRHLFFAVPHGVTIPNQEGIFLRYNGEEKAVARFVDIRSDGGYVVAPPSVLDNGHVYEWECSHTPENCELAYLPEAWVELLTRPNRLKSDSKAIFKVPETIQSGERNGTLFRLACSLQHKGLTENAILAAVRAENEARCVPPLPDREIRSLVESAAKYPAGENNLYSTAEKANSIAAPDGTRLADIHPERNDRYKWTDIGNGNLFADWYKGIARYCPEKKKWFIYDGVRWKPDTDNP